MARATTHTDLEKNYNRRGNATAIDENQQRQKYGGFHFGAAMFGWLVSTGMAAILTGILAAAGSAVAVTSLDQSQALNSQTVNTVGLASGVLFLLVLAVAYYAGGYVAGRMSRFDGVRQGFGVWVIGILITLILGGLGAAIGANYNVLQQINLPHIPIEQGSFTTGGLITSLVAIIVSLLAALGGGKAGERYHRKIDSAGVINPSD
ncbi:MAG: conserved rane protein of unknown function [Candidatus Saccharibacteria bacterium]|nr:conserved rane protein of unknown function [Candidatus Saccharibacteria bacterium]